MSLLTTLLIGLLVGAVIFYLVRYAMGLLNVPQPIQNIVLVIMVLIAIVWIVERAGLLSL